MYAVAYEGCEAAYRSVPAQSPGGRRKSGVQNTANELIFIIFIYRVQLLCLVLTYFFFSYDTKISLKGTENE